MTVGISILAALTLGVIVGAAARRWAYRHADRRNWPDRVRLDYETERVRDHFFHSLSVADVEWLVSQGWSPPADIAARRARELEFRAFARLSEEERRSWSRLRAAGIHLTAHSDDVRFDA